MYKDYETGKLINDNQKEIELIARFKLLEKEDIKTKDDVDEMYKIAYMLWDYGRIDLNK